MGSQPAVLILMMAVVVGMWFLRIKPRPVYMPVSVLPLELPKDRKLKLMERDTKATLGSQWLLVEVHPDFALGHRHRVTEGVPVLELFSNIWGAGTKTAQMWYQQGFRSLDDIRDQVPLTTQQAIGLKHYDDFLERMPREEAAEIEQTVRESAQALSPGLLCVACGSYRRGKASCGDVDVLVTHPDGPSHQGILSRLLENLRQQGFLTDDLVSQEENGQQQKYLGVCRLPGPGRRHRRLDIITVPYGEFACALLYFTGSALLCYSSKKF
ncbi:DNA polymerase lambda-like [Sorex fumeus]|uniref:DNA polymerase lambda-like n=1 Tax=Sorex fumeus TaxID=62283 RepID=UPI0024ADFADC|nr:DNA polymerase lambda-like [Sorex fumeus]